MALDSFISKFDSPVNPAAELCPPLEGVQGLDWQAASKPGALDKFIDRFNGVTEPYFFYNGTIELRFQVEEHIYYRVGDLGQLTPQDGVTTICHIIDKSNALVPWSAKMVAAKLLRTIPTVTREVQVGSGVCHCGASMEGHAANDNHAATEQTRMEQVVFVPELTLEDFTKLVLEAKSAPRDKLEEAGDIGHMAHTWLEYYIKAIIAGDTDEQQRKLANLPADERARNCVMAALGWMHTHNVRWISTERKIYSKRYSYAGTMDGLATVDSCDDPLCNGCRGEQFKDRLSIIDWKSSNYLYIEYLYQTAAYEAAYEEEFGVEVLDRWILRLGKEDGEFDPWHTTEEDFQEDFEAFLDALSLTRSVHLTEERMKGQKKVVREAKKAAKAAVKELEKAAKQMAAIAAKVERRAAKALEKEAIKAKKAAERAAVKANRMVPAQIVAVQEDDNSAGEELDNCEVCLGAKGGEPGNENVIDGVVMCDYCHYDKYLAPEQGTVTEAVTNALADNRLAGLPEPTAGTITGRLAITKLPYIELELSDADTKVLVDALLNPPAPNEALKELMTMDFSAVEKRIIDSLSLPTEQVASYGLQLPVEKVAVILMEVK